jgi:hypothetical protein
VDICIKVLLLGNLPILQNNVHLEW